MKLQLPTYPARPVNGGRFDYAPAKTGEWLWSVKVNEWRAPILLAPDGPRMFNRQGAPLSIAGAFEPVMDRLRPLCCPCGLSTPKVSQTSWLDCGAFERRHPFGRGSLVVLDLPTAPGTARDRLRALMRLAAEQDWPAYPLNRPPEPQTIYWMPQFRLDEAQPGARAFLERLWARLQILNTQFRCEAFEGLVARHADKPYPVNTRDPEATTPWWVKHRFVP